MEISSTYTVFIGNPGAGKSTLLNGLAQRVLFHSGVSFATGMTTKHQLHHVGDRKYLGDTPGLSDVKLRKVAAEEIETILKQGGQYRLVFLVTLEAGRVRPEDTTTIKLVLQAVPDYIPFAVVINKLEPSAYGKICGDPELKKTVFLVVFFCV